MNKYEKAQVKAIENWKHEEPGVIGQAFEFVTAPLTWLVALIVPVPLVKIAIEGTNTVAQGLADSDDILRDGGVSAIDELRTKGLKVSDTLAEDVHNWAIATSGAGGAALGATGVGGVALDVSALITIALRTIHKIGLCYGYDRVDPQFVLGVLAAASANNRDEKMTALDLLRDVEAKVTEEVIEEQVKDAVKTRIAKAGTFFTARGVGKRLGRNLAQRKALQLVPLVGAVLGGATNISFLRDVGWAARHLFQERWLMENGRLPAH
jgi:hypothetical protein